MLSTLWNELLYRPFYNALIWLVTVLPGHNLALAIVLLTIVIRALLYIPSKKGIKSQKKLQEIQPKLNELKIKYKNNSQMQAQETMKLYKEYGVNPFSSCLPVLIQLPVFFALFTVFRNGLSENIELLYKPLQSFDFSQINTSLFGFAKISVIEKNIFSRYVMPLLVGGLQFWQLSSMSKKNKAQAVKKAKTGFDPQATNKMMTYFMPLMIAWISTGYPASLSLYWATSTAFSIFQQKKISIKKIQKDGKIETKDIEEAKTTPVKKKKKKKKK